MQAQYLECGKIVSTHGVHGEIKVQPWCNSVDFLLAFGTLYLKKGEIPLRVESARTHKNMALLKLRGYDSMEQAAQLRGKILYMNRDDAPPGEEGEYFVQDLLGLSVRDADTGAAYGELTDVFPTGANDVYEVTGGDSVKRLVPAIAEVVLSTDVEAGVMLIRPLRGLFDDAD